MTQVRRTGKRGKVTKQMMAKIKENYVPSEDSETDSDKENYGKQKK